MSDTPRQSRRKRRGTGAGSPTAAPSRVSTIRSQRPSVAAKKPEPKPKTLSIGRYERGDFERVEGMLAAFANRRLANLIPQVARGFFAAATKQEQQLPELRSAFYSFLFYGWRDGNGVRVIDLFRRLGPGLKGRQLAALEACTRARLGLVQIDDVNIRKQRIRGRDVLRDEKVTLRDKNAVAAIRPGDRLLTWQIPWGTTWQPIGVATRIEARKVDALNRAI
ncbi:MAG TPA: hypothetical protein ENK31_01260, partial [Nannocystis exedens]|nr:hypothetical protein [Nannocystis exedens]